MSENKLQWEEFEPLFGSFAPKMKIFFDRGGFEPIYSFLKEQSKEGKLILPESENTFKFLSEMDINNIHTVVVGLCPYHTLRNKEIIADGIPMSCKSTNFLQPSLSTFYDGIISEFDLNPQSVIKDPDNSYLLKNGIWLINIASTTEYLKPGNHCEIWHDFTQFLFESIISPSNVPIIFLGKEAAKFKKYLLPLQWEFSLSHPASISYSGSDTWGTLGAFKKVSKIVEDMNGIELKWLKTKEILETNDELPF